MDEIFRIVLVSICASAGAYAAVRVELKFLWREISLINRFIGRDQAPARK